MTRSGHGQPEFADEGFTLIELLVAMTLLVAVMAAFLLMYLAFGTSGRSTQALSQTQGSTHLVIRQLESDIRSADPLLQWPASPSDVPASIGGMGTANTDKIAMYLPVDSLLSCPSGSVPTTTSGSLTPFEAGGTFSADVIWVYDATAGTLNRYVYANCGNGFGWQTTPEMSLSNVVDAPGTMFSAVSAGTQATLGVTVAANQAAPTCASAMTISISAKASSQTSPFKVAETIPLPNQPAVKGFACS